MPYDDVQLAAAITKCMQHRRHLVRQRYVPPMNTHLHRSARTSVDCYRHVLLCGGFIPIRRVHLTPTGSIKRCEPTNARVCHRHQGVGRRNSFEIRFDQERHETAVEKHRSACVHRHIDALIVLRLDVIMTGQLL